jgi:hypothetical protein
MPVNRCATHPEVEAIFRCDGCGSLLCPACVEEGHRLLFCRLCRERALPLDASAPATVPERRRTAARARPFSWRDAALYPVRGQGGGLFWVYLALMLVFQLAARVPGLWLLTAILGLYVAFLVPGLLYAIVRETAAGNDQLPEWPDIMEPGERLRESLTLLGIAVLAILPVALLLRVVGCGAPELLGAERLAATCWLALLAGLLPGLALAVPMLGALAIYESRLLLVRPDLHARALLAAGVDGLRTIGLVYAFLIAGQLLAQLLRTVPWLGGVLATGASAYAAFVGAHLVGCLFRRHEPAMDAIYL